MHSTPIRSSRYSGAARLARRGAASVGVGALTVLAVAGPVAAHPADEAHVGGGLNGFLHPLGGTDHLAAMLAVGVVAALAARRLSIWAVPAAFLGGMVAGGALGFAGLEVGVVESVIVWSVVALGLLVAVARQAPLGLWLLPAVGLVGAAHGNAHGLEAPAAASPLAYIAGFVAATALLHAAGAAAGWALRRFEIGQIVTGAAIAAFGVTLALGS